MSRMKTISSIDTRLNILADKLNTMAEEQLACHSLDKTLEDINKALFDNNTPIPDEQLQSMILELANQLYFAVDVQERLGIKEDVAKLIRQEMYCESKRIAGGTVAEKEAKALLDSQYEEMVQIVYSRAYKRMKSKVDAGYEMLNALKKILGARLSELELSKSRYIGGQPNEPRERY